MRDRQVAAFLQSHSGFVRGVISSNKLNLQSKLSEILESGEVEKRYYLSPLACRGILRRAENRGKELPTTLRRALEQVAEGSKEPTTREGKTA